VGLLQAGGGTAEKTVVITFDDGYRNFCQHAFPALEQFGFTASMFLPTASIGDQSQVFNRRECMTWGEVRELQQRGISFGSHTVNHPQLYGLEPDRIREEIVRSRQTIEDKAGCAVNSSPILMPFRRLIDRSKRCCGRLWKRAATAMGFARRSGGLGRRAILCFWNDFRSTVRTIRRCYKPNWLGLTTG
jgi:hypothetical protein